MRIYRFAIVGRLTSVLVLSTGCHSTPAAGPSSPTPVPQRPPVSPPTVSTFERGIAPRQAPPLPQIPLVDGPLAPKLVYPEPNQQITVRDSNFIFGSVGSGRAQLTINGAPVKVAPNGTFLAFLPALDAVAKHF